MCATPTMVVRMGCVASDRNHELGREALLAAGGPYVLRMCLRSMISCRRSGSWKPPGDAAESQSSASQIDESEHVDAAMDKVNCDADMAVAPARSGRGPRPLASLRGVKKSPATAPRPSN